MKAKAKVREHRHAHGQARQAKGKRESRYVIKVVRLKGKGGAVSLARENQRIKGYTKPFNWSIIKLDYIYLLLSCKM